MAETVTARTFSRRRSLAPLLWLGPALVLILLVVLTPVFIMLRTAFRNIDAIGFDHGWAGWRNFRQVFHEPDLHAVLLRTVWWVVAVVVITMVFSLALAALFNQTFPGRRVARWALIAPWAASVFMTAVVFRWMLQPGSGLINVLMHRFGLLDKIGDNASHADWLGRPEAAFWWMIAVAVFVSIPFTTYALLAGLQTIPPEVYEAARVDGSSTMRSYVSITLPLLRPALTVATLINIMNVFNSFPIIWEMTRGGPGDQTATTTVFMYQIKAQSIPEAAAMSVVNFGFVIVIVLVFLKASRWKEQVS
ncbi:MAG: binding-protein-dependent transport system inner rane component [Marmoricola sp.]|nr:binding-protein-dependent transport system inner rane component [Marmoricola sp.]